MPEDNNELYNLTAEQINELYNDVIEMSESVRIACACAVSGYLGAGNLFIGVPGK